MWRFYTVIIGILLGLTACDSANVKNDYVSELQGAVINPPRVLDDFTLMSTTGEEFTLSEHRGEAIIIYFGYRACPDFCPMTFSELKRVYADLDEPADKMKVVFVSIDPERDDLESLTLYTNAFHEDFIGLRSDDKELERLMDQFGVVAEKQVLGDSALAYLYDHTATLFLINPKGELEVQYLFGTPYRSIVNDVSVMLDIEIN
jgi:protein SCO1